jgi:Leucine-rich repeat (LRR) protein
MPRLKRIPKHIARFTELKNLDVNYSGRTKLPSNLAKKLNGLSVTVGKGAKKNALRNLKKFTKLKSLGISGMAPDWKPKKLFGLDQLEELYINFCHFNKIDFTGSFLKGLEELDLEDNELIELPTGLDNLPKLTILRLSHNKIEQLPNDICKLKQIIYLYLDDNNIKTLRDSISEMKNLQKISLKNNPIPASEKERLKKALPDVEFVFE